MPRDQWASDRRKAKGKAVLRDTWKDRTRKHKLRHAISIPAGTPVLVRREDSSESLRPHTTKQPLSFSHFHAASPKAYMFSHSGYQLWVGKSHCKGAKV